MPPPLPPVGEPDALSACVRDCFHNAARLTPDALDAWLQAQPVLWSLSDKAEIGERLLRALAQNDAPVSGANFDRLSACFGYQDLHNGYDPLELQQLRGRLDRAYQDALRERQLQDIRRGKGAAFDWRGTGNALQFPAHLQPPVGGMPSPWSNSRGAPSRAQQQADFMLRLQRWYPFLLSKRFSFRNVLANMLHSLAMNRSLVADTARLLRENPYGGPNDLPETVNRDQIAFWLAADDDGRMSVARVCIALARCIAVSTPIMGIVFLALASSAPELGITAGIVLKSILWPVVALFGGWLANAGWKHLLYWQTNPQQNLPVTRFAQRSLALVLSGVSLLLTAVSEDGPHPLPLWPAMLALSLSVARVFRIRPVFDRIARQKRSAQTVIAGTIAAAAISLAFTFSLPRAAVPLSVIAALLAAVSLLREDTRG